MIKFTEFVYSEKPRKLYQTVGKPGFVEGIECSAMTEEEFNNFSAIVEDFHKKLDPFMKFYRRYDPHKMN